MSRQIGRADELTFLRYAYEQLKANLGPADGLIVKQAQDDFERDFELLVPEGYRVRDEE